MGIPFKPMITAWALACAGLSVAEAPSSKADPKAPTKVFLFFDTEDFTCDRSNDAIRDIARLLTEEGAVGHFNVVGYLARQLVQYRRTDVLDALKPHAIGTQTLYHSVHPDICEISDLEDYDAAYRAVLAQESEGLGMIKAATGVERVLFQDPPGNSWSYVSLYAYADLGLKFYCGGGFTDHPMGQGGAYGDGGIVRRDNIGEGLWYCNLYQVPYSHIMGLEALLPRADGTRVNVPAVLDRIAKRDLVALYMHPHMAVKTRHWDGPNYMGGNRVTFGNWIQCPDRPAEDTAEFYVRLRDFVRRLKNDPRFALQDLREFEKTLKPRQALTRADVPTIRAALTADFGPVSKPASWSVADCFRAVCAFLTGETTYLPEKAYGFLYAPKGVKTSTRVKAADLKVAAKTLRKGTFIPPSIDVGGIELGPADFLFAALDALETGADEVVVTPREQLGSFREVPSLENVRIKDGWCIHSKEFEDKYLSDRLRLQLWTMRFE